MGKNKINIALFGLGRIGQMHAENLINHPQFYLKYIFDIDKNLTEKLLLWTGDRWIISLSKNTDAKSIYEKNLEDKSNKIEEFKKNNGWDRFIDKG